LDMTQQVQAMADPVSKKLQHLLGNVDRMVNSINVLFDTTRGTNDIRSSLNEAKMAIKRFGNLSLEMNDLVKEEKIIKTCKFSGLSCADTSKNFIFLNIQQ